MVDREKVIEGLEMSFRYSNVDESNTLVPQQLVLDALALLKAQEPRVMTLEEVRKLIYGSPYIIETNMHGDEPRLMWGLYSHNGIGGNFDFTITDGRHRLFDVDYGKTWRCWTSRPDDATREATPWN